MSSDYPSGLSALLLIVGVVLVVWGLVDLNSVPERQVSA
eukprot:SAG31_NODE_30116_length_385_cov_0.734266_1_plen_39_part_00